MIKIQLKENEMASLIAKNGDTQVSFSNKIGITKQGLGQILSGKFNPSPVTAKRICDVLDCDFDEIFITE